MPTPEFEQLRQQLQGGRTAVSLERQALFLAQEKARQLADAEQSLARVFDPQNEHHLARRQELDKALAAEKQRIGALSEALTEAETRLAGQLEALLPQTDPREHISEMDDRYPILLLPLRLETRFKQIQDDGGAARHELWVRVYPDDVAIDTFEQALSEAEVRHARLYWQRMWAAAGQITAQQAAWRELVAGHGAGRALHIVDSYRPLNETERPTAEDDIMRLVIGTDTPLTDPQVIAAAAFWEAIWRNGGTVAGAQEALDHLAAAVGPATAQLIIDDYRPLNLQDPPPAERTRETASVSVLTVIFEPAEETATRRRAWSKAPSTDILPDRFVLLGYADDALTIQKLGRPIPSPLAVGPDPQATGSDQMRQVGDDLDVGPALRWLVDFDEAVQKGMGFRIPLTPAAFNRGLDRLLVLGVRLTSDEQDGRQRLERLLKNHHASRAGLALLPQGTATNNTDDKPADFSLREEADASFSIVSNAAPLFQLENDPLLRRDGQRLAEALGVDPTIFQKVRHSGRSDTADALAMNVALWPATIGYWMETMMAGVFNDQAITSTHQFFTRYVSGRGQVPTIRIGQQPYGILPVTSFSRLRWPKRQPGLTSGLMFSSEMSASTFPYLDKLTEILMRAYEVWGELAADAAHVGQSGDPHQILLDILGLHAASEEHYTRYAQSLQQVLNTMNLHGLGGLIQKLIIAIGLLNQGTEILSEHGYDIEEQGRPDLLDKYFLQTPTRLSGPLIEDQPLSEINPLQTITTDGRNYIAWLADSGRSSLETIRRQAAFDGQPPNALLYLTLRHALNLGYYDTAVRLYMEADLLQGDALMQRRREPNFIHVATQTEVSESRFQLLYQPEPAVTQNNNDLLIADFIPTIINSRPVAAGLRDQLSALDRLKDLATARLERVFVEHLDTCTYRLDAWLQGLVQVQLDLMRATRPKVILEEDDDGDETGESTATGVYLGAYGWLEDVQPDSGHLTPVDLDDETLAAVFAPGEEPQLMRDSENAGYIHAPSLNQAVTAAVLRNGYLSQADPTQPELFAVNLSSERVRMAMAILEGLQGGQSLGALLGYQFERGLHDRHDQAEVDRFIYPLRKKFPLRADHLADTASDETVSIEAIEARNVLDGVALIEHILENNSETYPFGLTGLPGGTNAQEEAINAEIQRLLNAHDAVADVNMAEGIHQAVQGNFDRAAATIDGLSTGQLSPLPDVVQTPRSGIGLTHRVALHLPSGASHTTSPVSGPAISPRGSAEANLNSWLARVLPPPNTVGVIVRLTDRAGLVSENPVTQADLDLQPLDLLYLLDLEGDGEMGALDDLIVAHVRGTHRPDATITIAYTASTAAHGLISFFALGALINHLRGLLLTARSLQNGDLSLPNEADPAVHPLPNYITARLEHLRDNLAVPLANLQVLATELEPLLDDTAANGANLVSQLNSRLERLVVNLQPLNRTGLPQTGFGDVLAWKRLRYKMLLDKVEALLVRWQGLIDRFDTLLAAYDLLPPGTPDEARLTALAEIEAQVRIVLTDPATTTPIAYRALLNARRGDFVTKQGEMAALLSTNTQDISALLSQIRGAAAGIEQFDFKRLDLDQDEAEFVRYSGEIATRAKQAAAEGARRVSIVNDDLATYNAATTAASRQQAAEHAAQTLLGEDFLFLPELPLVPEQGDELQKAYDDQAVILTHLQTTAGIDFPVDEWLTGIGRVRDKMNRLEGVVVLAEAFSDVDLTLEPLQLPYKPADSWLALPYPENYAFDGDPLLYTAHFAAPFNKTEPVCGLLVDEWTEVIPLTEETTGIAFHYDRPNSEPPQVMLLAVPPAIDGRWAWDDLVAILHETLALIERRAVEPDQIDGTEYARFLPATISATTFHPITIALNLALNNNVFSSINGENDDG